MRFRASFLLYVLHSATFALEKPAGGVCPKRGCLMSRRLVWLATFLLFSGFGLIAGPAFAQYPGYGAYDTDPYRTRLHDYGPGYSGGFGVETPDHSLYIDEYGRQYIGPQGGYAPPPPPAYAPPPAPAYSAGPPPAPAYAAAPPDGQVYADPLGTGPARAGHKASDYDLGDTAARKTAQIIPNPTHEPPGTVVIDTGTRHLYLVTGDGQAIEYGIGVGREGFAWKGRATVRRKAEWPSWTPPADMLKRRPDLPARMAGGIDNPLGARALYLFQGKRDTMFRIHGTNEPDTIGQAVSSGCIRMMNGDVIDLYHRVPIGATVVVL
jgi:lipoprotein-anchoring transpeptidase ErfK/SrfK